MSVVDYCLVYVNAGLFFTFVFIMIIDCCCIVTPMSVQSTLELLKHCRANL